MSNCTLEEKLHLANMKINVLSDEMKEISDVLVGYQEGSFHQIITEAKRLKVKAANVEIENQFSKIAESVNDLNGLINDIESDA